MNKIPFSLQMQTWFSKSLGKTLLQMENQLAETTLAKLFGYYLLQLGGPFTADFLAKNSIANRIGIDPTITTTSCGTLPIYCIQAEYENLPFLCESIDVALIMHVLEFSAKPRTILEQTYQTLANDGHLIIFGFNRCSLWGITKFFKKNKTQSFPWNVRFISAFRMRSWLDQIGFNITEYKTFYFHTATTTKSKYTENSLLEKIGRKFFPRLGGCYMLVAEKKVMAIPPIKARFFKKRIALNYAAKPTTPTARVDCNGK